MSVSPETETKYDVPIKQVEKTIKIYRQGQRRAQKLWNDGRKREAKIKGCQPQNA